MDQNRTGALGTGIPTLLGYLVAPAAAAIVMLGYVLWRAIEGPAPLGGDRDLFALGLSLKGSYLWTALLGLPAHLVLRRQGLTRWSHYVAAGLALAMGPVLVYFAYRVVLSSRFYGFGSAWRTHMDLGLHTSIFTGVCGAVVAATFWAIAVRRRRLG